LLSAPFLVIATQNPVETQGTFPLPEAQLDRFLIRVSMGYPAREDALTILDRFRADDPLCDLLPVACADDILRAQMICTSVFVHSVVRNYLLDLIEATRSHRDMLLGASPRASLSLLKTAMSYAAIQGRDFVTPDDIKTLFIPVIAHRLVLRTTGASLSVAGYGRGKDRSSEILTGILDSVSCPTEDFSP
jgi:MoxR-like ATPase